MKNYFENSEIFENFDDEMFSNIVDPNTIIQGVTAVAQVGGSIAQAKAQKEASKLDITKLIETRCGKRKNYLRKDKQRKYDECKSKTYDEYEKNKQANIQLQQQQLQNQQKMAIAQAEEKKKSSQRNLYIGLGVLIVLVGVAVYFKQKS